MSYAYVKQGTDETTRPLDLELNPAMYLFISRRQQGDRYHNQFRASAGEEELKSLVEMRGVEVICLRRLHSIHSEECCDCFRRLHSIHSEECCGYLSSQTSMSVVIVFAEFTLSTLRSVVIVFAEFTLSTLRSVVIVFAEFTLSTLRSVVVICLPIVHSIHYFTLSTLKSDVGICLPRLHSIHSEECCGYLSSQTLLYPL
ncbi:hypothetical protein RRG08_045332 [Elysia crispata]|uniref:Uncharacterized protein n=1 Tax=Elysia crispata TaxID=231223 RepID=A0AAE1A288_9GAST|nr:hypothetical protein RRG08_045332 [Elysia crispata]